MSIILKVVTDRPEMYLVVFDEDGRLYDGHTGGWFSPEQFARMRDHIEATLAHYKAEGLDTDEIAERNRRLREEQVQAVRENLERSAKKKPAALDRQGYVYLMQDARNDAIKIGFSKRPPKRERTLQSEVPEIILLRYWAGTLADEKALHEQFDSKRIRGEWFDLTGEEIATLGRTEVSA